ncbi:MAG: hypothetical protein M3220_07000, partial [Chloroflexota bacterium]|nr:hypothetical protein [Chloroflexota bacterium]
GILRTVVAALVMGSGLWLLTDSQLSTALSPYLFTPAAVAVGGMLYLVVAWVLGVEEIRLLPRMIRRRSG